MTEHSQAFEAYGRVMAKVGGLEQFMRIALCEHESLRMSRSGKASRQEMEKQARKIMKMDFGKLRHQVWTKFKLAPEILTVLKEAKNFRDHLAHDFWVTNLGNLRTDRGRTIVLQHCELLERQFEKVADLLIAVTGLNAIQYISFVAARAEDEEIFRAWEVRLDAARKAEDAARTVA